MRDYRQETEKRIGFIRESLASAGARGIVYGNSGGKDSALVGILCKMACEDTLGIICPADPSATMRRMPGMPWRWRRGLESLSGRWTSPK